MALKGVTFSYNSFGFIKISCPVEVCTVLMDH